MKRMIRHAAATASVSLCVMVSAASPAAAYPIDCAILLCLAGGWPGSAECTAARAEFIRRITPWPIEPPLQIWNCPMRAGFNAPQAVEKLQSIAAAREPSSPLTSLPPEPSGLRQVQNRADVDISDPGFDFVRSIRVFEITYQQRRSSDGDCNTSATVYEGSYGAHGDYQRRRTGVAAVPKASDLAPPVHCRAYKHRSVFVEWRDLTGTYGHEEVHY